MGKASFLSFDNPIIKNKLAVFRKQEKIHYLTLSTLDLEASRLRLSLIHI